MGMKLPLRHDLACKWNLYLSFSQKIKDVCFFRTIKAVMSQISESDNPQQNIGSNFLQEIIKIVPIIFRIV